jgi:aspartyl-tRNA(Asn)/glutamyl-tRNA(Gln) amidotransferase subunit C
MSFDTQHLDKIKALSCLKLSPEQAPVLVEQINSIVQLADTLSQEDTTGIEPMAHPLALFNPVALRLREDLAYESNQRQANMANAPAQQDGLFLVPKVIE